MQPEMAARAEPVALVEEDSRARPLGPMAPAAPPVALAVRAGVRSRAMVARAEPAVLEVTAPTDPLVLLE